MKQEDKELLLKDLCARLPYDIKVITKYNFTPDDCWNDVDKDDAFELDVDDIFNFMNNKIEIKPFLRPISSMTEEEMDRLFDILHIDKDGKDDDWIKINDVYGIKFFFPTGKWIEDVAEAYDYLYSIHIDFRGLIGKGLALEAPSGMYE